MNLLVICPNWVGDAVMATPALRALRGGLPEARIVGTGRPVIAQVLEGLGYFDAWLDWQPRGGPRVARTGPVGRALRRERLDAAIVFPNGFRAAWLAWMSGAPRRIGYSRDWRGWLLTRKLFPRRSGRRLVPSPAIEYYLELAQAMGCRSSSRRMDLSTSVADERSADAVWEALKLRLASKVVAFNPGAAFGPSKLWPASHFGELARGLLADPGVRVLVLSGPGERELAREIVSRTDRPGIHSLADFTVSIGLSKACVRRSDLLVTTDSGPRHFAAAFDVPVVTLFGPTHIGWSETCFPKAVHLQKEVPCGPCQLPVCPLDHRCMRELLPGQALEESLRLLERYPRRSPSLPPHPGRTAPEGGE